MRRTHTPFSRSPHLLKVSNVSDALSRAALLEALAPAVGPDPGAHPIPLKIPQKCPSFHSSHIPQLPSLSNPFQNLTNLPKLSNDPQSTYFFLNSQMPLFFGILWEGGGEGGV